MREIKVQYELVAIMTIMFWIGFAWIEYLLA